MNFIPLAEARKLPAVLDRYSKRDITSAAVTEARGAAGWARFRNGAPASGDLATKVNLDALPEAL